MNDIEEQDLTTETAADFIWDDGKVAKLNYEALGDRMARSGDLFRNPQHGSGLIQHLSNGKHATITRQPNCSPSSWTGCEFW